MDNSSTASTVDKMSIVQLINQFGRALDLRDWKTFRNLFADSVEFDYSAIGDVAGTLSPDDIVNNARKNFSGFEATQHLITNHIVEVAGEKASCHAHVRAYHFLPNDKVKPRLEIGGYYTAKLVHLEEDWKIKQWKFSVLWISGDEELFELAKEN